LNSGRTKTLVFFSRVSRAPLGPGRLNTVRDCARRCWLWSATRETRDVRDPTPVRVANLNSCPARSSSSSLALLPVVIAKHVHVDSTGRRATKTNATKVLQRAFTHARGPVSPCKQKTNKHQKKKPPANRSHKNPIPWLPGGADLRQKDTLFSRRNTDTRDRPRNRQTDTCTYTLKNVCNQCVNYRPPQDAKRAIFFLSMSVETFCTRVADVRVLSARAFYASWTTQTTKHFSRIRFLDLRVVHVRLPLSVSRRHDSVRLRWSWNNARRRVIRKPKQQVRPTRRLARTAGQKYPARYSHTPRYTKKGRRHFHNGNHETWR